MKKGTRVQYWDNNARRILKEHNRTLRQLTKLADALAEKRSDISEIVDCIAKGNKWSVKDIEHRLIYAEIPLAKEMAKERVVIRVEYDTLTTELSYENALGEWAQAENHKYI
jgi:hypothetical protein